VIADTVPDANTPWDFREALIKAGKTASERACPKKAESTN
jgi:hypothetical protein